MHRICLAFMRDPSPYHARRAESSHAGLDHHRKSAERRANAAAVGGRRALESNPGSGAFVRKKGSIDSEDRQIQLCLKSELARASSRPFVSPLQGQAPVKKAQKGEKKRHLHQ